MPGRNGLAMASVYTFDAQSESFYKKLWITLSFDLAERQCFACNRFSVFLFGSALAPICKSNEGPLKISTLAPASGWKALPTHPQGPLPSPSSAFVQVVPSQERHA